MWERERESKRVEEKERERERERREREDKLDKDMGCVKKNQTKEAHRQIERQL